MSTTHFGPDDARLIIEAVRGRMPAAGDDRAALRKRVAELEREVAGMRAALARHGPAVRVMPSRDRVTRGGRA